MKPWQKTEKKHQEILGAKPVPRSGGFWSNKGDQRDEYFNYDSKDTKAASYILKSSVWQKIYNDALKHNRMPVLTLALGTGEDLVVMSLADFTFIKEQFIKQMKEQDEKQI